MIKVSIIIPVFNAEKFIKKCLDSLLKTKLIEIEVLIINDGSTDESLKILNTYTNIDKRIKVFDQENSGQARARNKMLKEAKGEYIIFIDIDDYVDSLIIDKMYYSALENDADFIYCDYYEDNGNNKKLVRNNIAEDNPRSNAILANFAPWAKLYRRSFLNKINFQFPTILFEDITVIPIANALAKNPIYIQEGLYYYNNINDSSSRRKKYNQKLEDLFMATENLYQNALKHNLLNNYHEEIEYIFLDSILKGGVLRFADFREGLVNIPKLRKQIKALFPHLLKNKYYKNSPQRKKIITLITIYIPVYLLFVIKKIKKRMIKK